MSAPAIFAPVDSRTFAIITEIQPCSTCGVMHAFFYNRDGKTRCIECDVKYQKGEGI